MTKPPVDTNKKILKKNIRLLLGYGENDIIPHEALFEKVVQYYENIIRCMPGNVYWFDEQCITVGCNKNVLDMFGFSSYEQFQGLSFEAMGKLGNWSTFATESFKKDSLDVLRTGQPKLHVEEPVLPHHKGDWIYFLSNRVPLCDENGRVIGMVGISIDITERKVMEQNLKESMLKTEAANQAKTQFIANMSHDLRTPLIGIVGMAELLTEQIQLAEAKENAKLIYQSGQQLLNLLNDILDMVSVENDGATTLQNQTFNLRLFLEDLINLEKPSTTIKNLDLSLSVDDAIPTWLISDKTRLHRILLNLIGNAIKFTKEGSVRVEVLCIKQVQQQLYLRFNVIDTGIGIPDELHHQVFDRFFRANPSYHGLYEGHGIGLHIAQSYVHLLGGEIYLKSNAEKGSTFTFELPFTIPTADDIPTVEIESLPSLAVSPGSFRVLLVEDNNIALKVATSMVIKAGGKLKTATNSQQALVLLEKDRFDLIITDIGLPGIDGIELTKIIRQKEHSTEQRPIPIIGLTAHAHAQKDCLQAGMNLVYRKPITLTMMRHIVGQFIHPTTLPESPSFFTSYSATHLSLQQDLLELNNQPLLDINLAMEHAENLPLVLNLLQSIATDVLPQALEDIKKAYINQQWPTMAKLAHKLKSAALYCGTIRLKYACQYLEQYQKTNQSELLESLYTQLIDVLVATKQHLDKVLMSS